MELKLIKTAEDYQAALNEMDSLIALDPQPNSPEANEIELIAVLMQHFDDAHSSMRDLKVSPIEMIRFVMEQQGLTNKDLIPFIGTRTRVYEVLSGKRELSKKMISAIHEGLGIPVSYLFETSSGKKRSSAVGTRSKSNSQSTRHNARQLSH